MSSDKEPWQGDRHRHWTNIRRETGKLFRKLLAPNGTRELPPKYPQDFSDFSKQLCETVLPYTMTSKERLVTIESATRYLLNNDIQGAFVESGVLPILDVAYHGLGLGLEEEGGGLEHDLPRAIPAPPDAARRLRRRHPQPPRVVGGPRRGARPARPRDAAGDRGARAR